MRLTFDQSVNFVHMADMDEPPKLFDRNLLRARYRRARAMAGRQADFLLVRAADDLADRLSAVTREFATAVDLSAGGTLPRAALRRTGKVSFVTGAESAPFKNQAGEALFAADEEWLPLADQSIDLVTSLLSLQWANDLPGILVQIRRALKPDGLLLGALIGGETLRELREALTRAEIECRGGASPRIAPLVDVRELGGLLQRAGFAMPVTDVDRVVVRYDHIIALMHDLRAMGATNILLERSRSPLTRDLLLAAAKAYQDHYCDEDGRIRATFDIIWFSGWAPDKNQQRPLRPGSAKTRLADALGTREFSAGEKARPQQRSKEDAGRDGL